MNRAVFLDRDGVINREVDYLYRIEDVEFIDGVFETCRLFRRAGFKLVVISNQAGIARGYYGEAEFHALMDWMGGRFRDEGAPFDAVYFCPHHPTAGQGLYRIECACRKPRPGMIEQAVRDLRLDLNASFLVG